MDYPKHWMEFEATRRVIASARFDGVRLALDLRGPGQAPMWLALFPTGQVETSAELEGATTELEAIAQVNERWPISRWSDDPDLSPDFGPGTGSLMVLPFFPGGPKCGMVCEIEAVVPDAPTVSFNMATDLISWAAFRVVGIRLTLVGDGSVVVDRVSPPGQINLLPEPVSVTAMQGETPTVREVYGLRKYPVLSPSQIVQMTAEASTQKRCRFTAELIVRTVYDPQNATPDSEHVRPYPGSLPDLSDVTLDRDKP